MAKKSDPTPQQTIEAPAGKKVVVDNRPLWKKKRFVIPVALIALVIAINALSGNNDESDQGGTSTASASSSTSDGGADDGGSAGESESAGTGATAGTRENPLPLGEVHSRDVGLTGTGWDISIDNVERVGLASFAGADVTGECIVVSGTATAREVDTDDGLSNIYSFPDIHVVVSGADLGVDDQLACDVQPAGYENYLTGLDMSVAEGGTVQWVKAFHSNEQNAPIDWIAVEETVYQVPA